MTRLTHSAVVAAIAFGSVGRVAAAKLQYEMHPGDLECPSATRFADEVTAKLGFSPWTDGGRLVHVTIDVTSGRYTGHFAYENDRERAFRAETCRRVADLLVTAAAIALDRSDPTKPAPTGRPAVAVALYTNPIRVASDDSPPPRADEVVLPANPAVEWAFAPRNDDFQVGLGYDSIGGTPMISGAIPLFRGHFDVGIGHTSTTFDMDTISQSSVSALYMWPVFYINKNSSFEMPIFAGGGVAYDWWSVSGNGNGSAAANPSTSKLLPVLAVSQGLQFRKWPIEFLFAMDYALTSPPNGGSNFGVDLALRYVFRGH